MFAKLESRILQSNPKYCLLADNMQLLPPFSYKASDTVLTARAVAPFPCLIREDKTGT